MTKRTGRATIEWVGGVVSLPSYVTGEGEPYRPEALLWLDAEGAVIGMLVDKPGVAITTAASSLQQTMRQPMWGQPHVPHRVRLAAPELVAVLREAHPNVEFVCAPTPEIDTVLAAMRADMAEQDRRGDSYLSGNVDAGAVAALFHATAQLFRAHPWTLLSGDDCLAVSIEALGIRNAALSLIGQLGESLGFLLFASFTDFQNFRETAQALERGEAAELSPYLALNFERGADLSDSLRKEIAVQRWEVAAANAYPWLIIVDADLIARGPTAEEVRIVEVLALALAQLPQVSQKLSDALQGGPTLLQTLRADTPSGTVNVTLQAPYPIPADLMTVIARLHELGSAGEAIDPEVLRPLEDSLIRHFAASSEAKALVQIHLCGLIMDLAATYFGATIVTLSPPQLRDILFDIIPRKVSIPADTAPAVIQELRALYNFLKRAGLAHAAACLKLLSNSATKRLATALEDTGNFGMAKSLVMSGRDAGFDLESQEGIEAFMHAMQGQQLPEALLPQVPRQRSSKSTKKSTRAKQPPRKPAPKKPR